MSPLNIQAKTLQNAELENPHHSDGHELIPAEIPMMELSDAARQSSEYVTMPGATQDDEGLLNNFAVEPVIYASEYPSPQQQKRYVLMGAGATLFVISLTLIAFFVS